jgi:hypothetical protein
MPLLQMSANGWFIVEILIRGNMQTDFNIHPRNHLFKNILGKIEYASSRLNLKKNELYVVNYHGTQKKFLPNFKEQLLFFKKQFKIISPTQLKAFYSGHLGAAGPFLLLTFDDGIKNNLFAATILNELQLHAFFFIVPKFINTPPELQKEYFTTNIRPDINPHIDSETEDFQSFSWADIATLMAQGHGIGSHTLSHTLVASTASIEKSILEISSSRERILLELDDLSPEIDSFCSINNTLESIGEKEMKLIRDQYRYHFTTIPGVNLPSSSPLYIKRCNIESYWLPGAVKYALGKWDLKRWKKADETYLNLLKKV